MTLNDINKLDAPKVCTCGRVNQRPTPDPDPCRVCIDAGAPLSNEQIRELIRIRDKYDEEQDKFDEIEDQIADLREDQTLVEDNQTELEQKVKRMGLPCDCFILGMLDSCEHGTRERFNYLLNEQ